MQPAPTVLVVDDDPDIVSSLSIHLHADGYRVQRATGGKEAIDQVKQAMPAIAIVDLMMPDMDGFETSRRLKRLADIPIIILTAIDTEETKVEAIERYADDYLTKPFSYPELAARVGRILKRAWPAGPPVGVDRIDDHLAIDLVARTVQVDGEERRLSPTEAKLLQVLVVNAGRILPNELLLDRVWPNAEGEMGYLWEYIRRLREKLSDDPAEPRYIVSERGIGYRFVRS